MTDEPDERTFAIAGLLEAMRQASWETDWGSRVVSVNDYDDVNELYDELERHGWKLVRADPFADVGLKVPAMKSCPICEDMCCDHGVLDTFTERLTKIEDWLDREDESWRLGRHRDQW